MIKAICFDLDGVYLLNGKSNFINNLGLKYGVSEDETKRVFLKSDQMNREYKLGKMTNDEFWGWAIKEWQLNTTVQEIVGLLISGYEINEKAAKYVKAVRNAGYRTLICSNNFPARINGLQQRFGFLNDFDTTVFSYDVGVDKPCKEIFQVLINKSGVNANEILYSDDDDTKMSGARELGIVTFLYKDFDGFRRQLEILGVKI